ncbi:MAG: beta-ketoacyl-[acyl-carrier-protein] synthase family protein [Pirellulales bacterium]|nr:beta-ketoacyl-[acyl-carrier-protein] synthase family protein [Pirellulales bacterium]
MNSAPNRVVITGMGLVSPLGSSKAELWEGLASGRSAIGPLTMTPAGALPVKFAAEAKQFTGDIENFGPLDKEQKKAIRKGTKMMCRECQMGVAAAQIALADAGFTAETLHAERTGVSYGSDYMVSLPDDFTEGIGQCTDGDRRFHFEKWGPEGLKKMNPLWLLKYLPNMPASHIGIYNDLHGPSNSVTSREASSNLALGEAFQIVLRGGAEAMLAGCTGTRLNPSKAMHVALQEELASSDAEPAKASRPFDLHRTGMVLGEGAGAVILENLAAAQARGAAIFGEMLAAASSCVVGRRQLANRRQAVENVLKSLLAAAGMKPEDIGHVNAHGLGTRSCDREEAQAIQAIFGSRAKPVPVVAVKSAIGNIGAAGGAVETIASLMALRHGHLFAALNHDAPDPDCPVFLPADGSVEAGSTFINLSVTPQGQASGILARRFEG